MAKTDLFGLKSSDSWQRQELGRLHIDYYKFIVGSNNPCAISK